MKNIKTKLHYIPALIVLMASLIVLVLLWQELSRKESRDVQDTFTSDTKRISIMINERMVAYSQVLRSGAGIFSVSKTIERGEWRGFVEKLDLEQNYKGIQGVGFSLVVPKQKLEEHIKMIRAQGFPDYIIKPAGEREIYTSIIYLEPFTGRNLRAFGYDMFSEKTRNEAMSRARDIGDVAFTGKVKLLQETKKDVQAGLLAYFPVYRNGAIPQTTEQRREALMGWVYSPYRMTDLLDAIASNSLAMIRLEVFDGEVPTAQNMLYDSHAEHPELAVAERSAISSTQRIELGGRYRTLRYTALPGYVATLKRQPIWIELLAITTTGLLLFGMTWLVINTRRSAETLADELTKSIRKSEARYNALFSDSKAPMLLIDPQGGRILEANHIAVAFYGYSKDQLESMNVDEINILSKEEIAAELAEADREKRNHFYFKHRLADGSIRDVEVHTGPVEVEGQKLLYSIIHDITDSSNLLRKLSFQIPGMIYQFRLFPDGRSCFPDSSEGIRDIYEVNPADVVSDATSVFKILHPGDYDSIVASINQSASKLEPWRLSYRVLLPQKGERWLHGEAKPERLKDGSTLWHGYIFDITEQKNIEKSLQKSQFLGDQALELAQAGHWNIDFSEGSEYYNSSAKTVEIFGDPIHEDMRYHIMNDWYKNIEAVDKDLASATLRNYLDAVEGKNPKYDMVHPYRRPRDGKVIWVHVLGHVIFDSNGNATNVYGVVMDITSSKLLEIKMNEANQALAQSESRFRSLFENSPIAYQSLDIEGRFTDVNQKLCDLLGYDQSGLIGKPFDMVWIDELKPIFPTKFGEFKACGHVGTELQLKNKDGHIVTVLLEGRIQRDLEGEFVRTHCVLTDISGRKELETTLLDAKEFAESLANSKAEFLANMSHEIRTPMNAIIGLSHLALNKQVSEEVRDYLEKINSSSESLLGILNDILDFSKMEAGKLQIENHRFNLDNVLDNLQNLFSHRAEEKFINFDIEVDENVPTDLIGDALRLQQILSNLLGNAIKFTERGRVAIKIKLLEAEESQARLHFCVCDTGIGISPEDQAKLFLPFSQVDTSASRRFGGTGLGLAISRNLLNLMGSDLHVESTQGQGSNFTFELLLSVASHELHHEVNRRNEDRKAGALSEDLRTRGQALSGARILVAEDNRINQQVVKEFLKLSGVHVDIANNGKEALILLEQNSYDAVLMDVHMPEMDGIEATEKIRRQARFQDLPVIALTAGVTKEEREDSLASGMNDFITKPINPEALIETLTKWVQPKVTTDAAQTVDSDDWSKIKDSLPGFDLTTLKTMIGGKADLLIGMLQSFFTDFAGDSNTIMAHLQKQEIPEAEKLLHRLKGAAGSLGALQLHQVCEVLDSQLKNGSYSQGALNQWLKVFDQTMVTLSEVLAKCKSISKD